MGPIGFLIGKWTGEGKSEGGNTDRGTSSIEPIVGGTALLRRDHNDVIDSKGKRVESFDQVMLIYAEAGTLRGDYTDGSHIIHYRSATVNPGVSVQFVTEMTPDAPAFRLTYSKMSPSILGVRFEMALPGTTEFHTVAEGQISKR
jgi:hypothetical protein